MVSKLFIPCLLLSICAWTVGGQPEKTLPGHESRGGCHASDHCGEGDNSVMLQHLPPGSANATSQKDAGATMLIEDDSKNDEEQHNVRHLLVRRRKDSRRRRECKDRRRRSGCDEDTCKKSCKEYQEYCRIENGVQVCSGGQYVYSDGYCAATEEGNQDCNCKLEKCSR
mmetsp:Transcript_2901/g.5238  ORF Transcript_2901/g.5238 Transcript_2901/m.5238 type:complete len:169 (-) Transcript_2901:266-772(-)|eukprot:CAMPEP_0197642710 /NCGR_PEP_ID=MMETSP1338-20131121/16291_1 /TAXON_ID=43686 ORGANISM="Pelagodinium beii, Strain RCC1491" /NCGR_SAMPLE_ID=MMETSP1338 /ASSEMBLY_ACC=CAM_ASM_000754 /LENGTH=168 /DNA_ID=CAMNT_0043215869 /DNA_START=50 /DNA_END=556 /DNA_ORIENTATION=-